MSVEPFIRCRDMFQSLAFYTQKLDFSVLQQPDPDPSSFMSKYAFLEREGSRVHLSAHAGDGVFGNVIYIRVTQLDIVYQQLLSSGLEIKKLGGIGMEPVEQSWGMREFSVFDPDGNRITYGEPIKASKTIKQD